MTSVSHVVVAGVMCEEYRRRVNLFYQALTASERAQLLSLLGCDTTGLLKLVVALVHPYILSHDPPSSPYLLPYAWKRKRDRKKRERARKRKIGENTQISKVLLPLPPRAMAEQDWTPSIVTPVHLQKLEK
jgi:hypothetical protein